MKSIQKVAVLGSGLMGTGIACHLANAGLEVLLLDILPMGASPEELSNKAFRNKLAQSSLDAALKAKPAPLMDVAFASRISIGNFEDDLSRITDYDWIIEVIVERLDIKKSLFEKVDALRKPGTLVTSNTSGIPINMMAEGRSEDFQKHFCGTHFFNPPRYLKLLEVIPHPKTDKNVIDFFMDWGDRRLGKRTVLCKDTPAFIANRVGVYAMAKMYQLTEELGLSIEDTDALTGPAIARPNTGTFRLGDLVGHDTAANVIKGIKENCPDDEQAGTFIIPSWFQFLLDNKFLGNKTKKGFYEKTSEKDANGKPVVLALNLKDLTYAPSVKSKLPSVELAKQIEDPKNRVKAVYNAKDKGGELISKSFNGLFAYVSNRIPEISDTIYSLDDALKAGFAWEFGPYEYWDIIGLEEGIKNAEAQGEKVAQWVKDMPSKGYTSFYKIENGKRLCYSPSTNTYENIPGSENYIVLDYYRGKEPIYSNSEVTLHDIGDQVLCLEFRSKANAIGEGILRGINDCIEIAENGDWRGIVIGNNSTNFTVGANLMMIAMLAYQQEFDELNMAVNLFQQTTMRCRYSNIPVVAATQGYVFGGGCETIMHCDSAIVGAESYIGLVEAGVGLIPGGAGTKEFAVRISDGFVEGDVQIPSLIERFKTIAMASVSTSGYEAFKLGLLNKKDRVIMNTQRNISEAKKEVLRLSENYVAPIPRKDVFVLGQSGLAALYVAAHSLQLGHFATEHDIKIAKKTAFVLCGGDLSAPSKVSEQYLLDLEREAFLSLCGEAKTLERIQHMLTTNKPLRN
jgi:3-hydroxyacyl-CoA dehydrogenase